MSSRLKKMKVVHIREVKLLKNEFYHLFSFKICKIVISTLKANSVQVINEVSTKINRNLHF